MPQQGLLQIRQFAVDSTTWTPLLLGVKFDQLWISYNSSLKLRSSPTDAGSEYTCQITDGSLYRVVGGSSLLTNQPITYMQSVTGSQVVTAMTGAVVQPPGSAANTLPPMSGHDDNFLYTNGTVATWQPLDGGDF